jgi:hypothetical protein
MQKYYQEETHQNLCINIMQHKQCNNKVLPSVDILKPKGNFYLTVEMYVYKTKGLRAQSRVYLLMFID